MPTYSVVVVISNSSGNNPASGKNNSNQKTVCARERPHHAVQTRTIPPSLPYPLPLLNPDILSLSKLCIQIEARKGNLQSSAQIKQTPANIFLGIPEQEKEPDDENPAIVMLRYNDSR